MSDDLRDLAFRLHLRGIGADQIVAALKREQGATVTDREVDGWIDERFAADPQTDPQHARTVAVIGEANRELWKAASGPSLQPAEKARYLEAISRNEERLSRIDGRCGARLRGARTGKFCMQFPITGKRRCKLHGGMSTGPYQNGNRRHGAYELVSVHDRTPGVRPDAMARITPEELARIEVLKTKSDADILDDHLRILVIARERLSPGHIDAHVKIATAEARLLEAKARLSPRRIELTGANGAPIETKTTHDLSRLTDRELEQLEALMGRSYAATDVTVATAPVPR